MWVEICGQNGVDCLIDRWYEDINIPVSDESLKESPDPWSIVTENGETFDPIPCSNPQYSDGQ